MAFLNFLKLMTIFALLKFSDHGTGNNARRKGNLEDRLFA